MQGLSCRSLYRCLFGLQKKVIFYVQQKGKEMEQLDDEG